MKEKKLGIWTRSLFAKLMSGTVVVLWLSGAVSDGAEPRSKKPDQSPHDQMVAALQLTPEQKARWDAAYAGVNRVAAQRGQYGRAEFFAKLKEEGKKAGAALKQILTPQQRVIYDQIKSARLAEAVGKKGAGAPKPLRRLGNFKNQ